MLLLAAVPLSASAQAQDVGRGQALAERWCANCHVVSRSDDTGRSNGLPTFAAIASRKDMDAATLKGTMSVAHSRMPEILFSARDQDDLAAYILSLRNPK